MDDKTPRNRRSFPGLQLTVEDEAILKKRMQTNLPGFRWRRIHMLQLLSRGDSVAEVAAALMTYPREVRRVGWRYIEQGLEASLVDEERGAPPKSFDATQTSALVALTCSDPPDGYAKWTLRLLAKHCLERGIVDEKVSYEVVRTVLRDHDLKPWREKNVVRSNS